MVRFLVKPLFRNAGPASQLCEALACDGQTTQPAGISMRIMVIAATKAPTETTSEAIP
jgi:hypothetical protein